MVKFEHNVAFNSVNILHDNVNNVHNPLFSNTDIDYNLLQINIVYN